MREASSLYAKRKWSYCAEKVNVWSPNLTLTFDLWTSVWGIIIVGQKDKELLYRNHFSTDRQTDR